MKALVIGGARSGYGAAALLIKMGYEVTLVSNSDFERRQDLEAMGVEVVLDDSETSQYDHFDMIVKNPGISNAHPLVKRFKHVINEIELASLVNTAANYYCVSGTNGKTTTVTMLYEMLKLKDDTALLAGNVGYALSEDVYHSGNIKRDIALEISAFQMDNTPTLKPKVYALLNLTPDHLDRYDSVEDYYQAKLRIVDRCEYFIRNFDDKAIVERTMDRRAIDVSLNVKKDVYIENNVVYFREVALFKVDDLKVRGEHNLMNAMFASTIAYLAGVGVEAIRSVLKEFGGVAHRIEYVDTLENVSFYNDSKGTNPEATVVALKSFDTPVILLAGGYDENISFDLLKQYKDKVKTSILFGESKYLLQEVFDNSILVEDLKEAVAQAWQMADSGDVILLSPACASYDQFKNFEERGNLFKEYVKALR